MPHILARVKAVPRNAPCPCGSGRKHKLCCGTTRDQERELQETLQRVIALPSDFPSLRASSDSFDRWADALDDLSPTRAVIEEGVAQLGDRERKRLVRAFEDVLPEAQTMAAVFLASAVVAALAERQRPDPRSLDLLEDGFASDPAEVLAFAIEPGDVWSYMETREADAAVAAIGDDLVDEEYEPRWNDVLAREAQRLATREHRRRLARLVARLAAFDPCACHPRAWEAIAAACATFERERELRERVPVMLLTDSLGRLWQRPLLRAA